MAVVEGFIDCVVDVAIVDVVCAETRLDLGEFVQLFGEIRSTVSQSVKGMGTVPLLVGSLSGGWEACQFAVDKSEHHLQLVVIQSTYNKILCQRELPE